MANILAIDMYLMQPNLKNSTEVAGTHQHVFDFRSLLPVKGRVSGTPPEYDRMIMKQLKEHFRHSHETVYKQHLMMCDFVVLLAPLLVCDSTQL